VNQLQLALLAGLVLFTLLWFIARCCWGLCHRIAKRRRSLELRNNHGQVPATAVGKVLIRDDALRRSFRQKPGRKNIMEEIPTTLKLLPVPVPAARKQIKA
jgi:hypothetical protein